MITSSTNPGSTPARLSASRITMLPSLVAGMEASAPWNDPTAVLAAETITDFAMEKLLVRFSGFSREMNELPKRGED
jgi:hypothetical protein